MPPVASLITALARKYGVDPRAALAVASVEGGLRYGAVGDQGTSFGPFQLHVGGALPAGRDAGWANSPAGLKYAISRMASSGARGLSGRAAVESIVRNFERPADPSGEIQRALAHYGSGLDGGSVPVSSAGPAPPPQAPSHLRRQLAMGLIQSLQGDRQAPDLPALLTLARQARSTNVTPSTPTPAFNGRPVGALARAWPHVDPQLLGLAQRFGLSITSGFRDHERNRLVGGAQNSYHMKGEAIDIAPNAAGRAAYQYALQHPELFTEAFFDPAGTYVKNGRLIKGAIGGHADHIHLVLA